jgi:hypothetical protein
MPDHAAHGQGAHDHGHHGHSGHGAHGAVMHEPAADWREAYTRAYEAAEPDPGREVISVELEAREVDWQFKPGRTTRAWGFNG